MYVYVITNQVIRVHLQQCWSAVRTDIQQLFNQRYKRIREELQQPKHKEKYSNYHIHYCFKIVKFLRTTEGHCKMLMHCPKKSQKGGKVNAGLKKKFSNDDEPTSGGEVSRKSVQRRWRKSAEK